MAAAHRWYVDSGIVAVLFAAAWLADAAGWLSDSLASRADVFAGLFGTLFGLGAAAYVFAVMLPSAEFATYLASKHAACKCHSSLDNLRFVFQWQAGSAISGLGLALTILIVDVPQN